MDQLQFHTSRCSVEEVNLHMEEIWFLERAVKVGVPKRLEDSSNVPFMFLNQGGPDHDVVQVYIADLANVFLQHEGNMVLMCCRCIATAHWHYNPFPETKRCMHCGVFDVVRMNTHLEGVHHVNLSPNFSFCTVGQYVIDLEKWEGIRNGDLVKYSVINNPLWDDGDIGFWDNERGWGIGRGWGSDLTGRNMLVNESLPSVMILVGTRVEPRDSKRRTRDDLDVVEDIVRKLTNTLGAGHNIATGNILEIW